MTQWTAERRITRGSGDTEKKEPRALHKAAWVHVCTARDNVGKNQITLWCGKRHKTAAEAETHAAQLNTDRDASAKVRDVQQSRARKRAA